MGTVALWAKRRVSVCHEDTGGWIVYIREGDCAAENVRGEIEKQKSGNEETSGVVVLRSRKSVWYTRLPVCVERQTCVPVPTPGRRNPENANAREGLNLRKV